ncbi:MAG: hypothetical protein HZB29_09815 [Nitrospinae bacterium]|nr:hypothetical protein [Nitrospinota bacterium]
MSGFLKFSYPLGYGARHGAPQPVDCVYPAALYRDVTLAKFREQGVAITPCDADGSPIVSAGDASSSSEAVSASGPPSASPLDGGVISGDGPAPAEAPAKGKGGFFKRGGK